MAKDYRGSFTSGEITPALHSRVDLSLYRSGAALVKNWFIHAQGGLSTRAGFAFASYTPNSTRKTRIIPFRFSSSQSYALAFGHQTLHIIRKGAAVLDPNSIAITAVSNASACRITVPGQTLSIGNKVYVSGIDGTTELNNRWLDIVAINGDEIMLDIDSTDYGLYISGGTVSVLYTIATPYSEDDLFRIKFTQSADVMTLTHPSYDIYELSRLDHDNWTLLEKDFNASLSAPTNLSIAQGGSNQAAQSREYRYVVTAVGQDGRESAPSNIGYRGSQALSITWYNILTWDTVPGVLYYNIYKEQDTFSGIFGWIGEATTNLFRDYNRGPDMTTTPPEDSDPFGAESPSCVTYHQQRQVFGGTTSRPETVWATKIGQYNSMAKSRPLRDDDAVEFTVVAQQVNEVRHLVSLDDLIVFTSDTEWRIQGDGNGVLTPYNVNPKLQGARGCSHVRPLIIGESLLYVQEKGSRVRDLGYTWESDKYTGNDLSIKSEHLFYGHEIVDWCYAQEPYSIVWAVRSDGVLLSLTYIKEHQVWGWSQHDTDGYVESVASVSEDDEDIVYAVIRREVEGQEVRYIERQRERRFDSIEDAYCVDAGSTYKSETASANITGLDHLEGRTVEVLADGNHVPALVVSNGEIALPFAAKTVHIGLPYICDLQTLAVNFSEENVHGVSKTVPEVHLRVRQTRGLKVGATFEDLTEIKQRNATHGYDAIPAFTGEQKLQIKPRWSAYGDIAVRQDYPLPATILALVPEVDFG